MGILISAACAAPAGPPSYHAPQPSYHHAPKYEEVPHPYEYAYGVKDEYTGTNFEAAEGSDGKAVHGHYSVLLPDGRLQNVKYTADHYTGYIADFLMKDMLIRHQFTSQYTSMPQFTMQPQNQYTTQHPSTSQHLFTIQNQSTTQHLFTMDKKKAPTIQLLPYS